MLTTTEVGRRAGLSYRQLDYWCRIGLLRPKGEGRGSGTSRRWTAREAAVVAVLAELVRAGRRPGELEGAALVLEHLPAWSGVLVVDGDGQAEVVDAWQLLGGSWRAATVVRLDGLELGAVAA